jgi:hypothetical protein
MVSQRVVASLVVAGLTACSSSGRARPSGPGVPDAQSSPISRNRDVITREELAQPSVRSQSVLEVVRSMRPHFLTKRGVQEIKCVGEAVCKANVDAGNVHASIDGGRVLPIEELANMHANSVLEIRFLSASAAMQRFGGAALEGPVILVSTIK